MIKDTNLKGNIEPTTDYFNATSAMTLATQVRSSHIANSNCTDAVVDRIPSSSSSLTKWVRLAPAARPGVTGNTD